MRCPYCGNLEDRVVDSRESKEGTVIRRRRSCVQCDRRFTSYERLEQLPFHVVKRDERRELYDRDKLLRGLQIACRKRPIPAGTIERMADEIELTMQDSTEREISSDELGNMVMERLRELDSVAYVRFASVYQAFDSLEDFESAITLLRAERDALGEEPQGRMPADNRGDASAGPS